MYWVPIVPAPTRNANPQSLVYLSRTVLRAVSRVSGHAFLLIFRCKQANGKTRRSNSRPSRSGHFEGPVYRLFGPPMVGDHDFSRSLPAAAIVFFHQAF